MDMPVLRRDMLVVDALKSFLPYSIVDINFSEKVKQSYLKDHF